MSGSDLPASANLTSYVHSSSTTAVSSSTSSNRTILGASTLLASVVSTSSSTSSYNSAENPNRYLASSNPPQATISSAPVSSASGTSFVGFSAVSSSTPLGSDLFSTFVSSSSSSGTMQYTSAAEYPETTLGTNPLLTSTPAHQTTVPVSPTTTRGTTVTSTTLLTTSFIEGQGEDTTTTVSSIPTNQSVQPATQVSPTTKTETSSSVLVSGSSSTSSSIQPPNTITKPPAAPNHAVSTDPPLITVTTQTTQSGHIFTTTVTLESIGPGSLVPVPTRTGDTSSPTSSSDRDNHLSVILGPILGALGLAALVVTFIRCRARRRSKDEIFTQYSNDASPSKERKDWTVVEEVSRVDPSILRHQTYSHRVSSTYTPEHITTCISYAGGSSQSSSGQDSDPFADSSDKRSSRTSVPPRSVHSGDSMSTELAFISDASVSVDTDMRDDFDIESLRNPTEASASSTELRFTAPAVFTNDDRAPSIRSRHLSPSWHYDSQPAASSPGVEGYLDRDISCSGVSSVPSALRTVAKPFPLGRVDGRLRLHALLREARRD